MKNVPPRPLRSSVELAAISKFLEEKSLNWDASTIASCSTYDGFDLMQELVAGKGWDFEREDLDTLDDITHAVDDALQDAEEKWAENHDVGSQALPDGTLITIGVITGVYSHGSACYLVKTPDCAPNSHRIIKFEDAVPL
jgi:hypothetical protein